MRSVRAIAIVIGACHLVFQCIAIARGHAMVERLARVLVGSEQAQIGHCLPCRFVALMRCASAIGAALG
ncbi:hypothetical protein XdyCFBP7245_03520 [Xanthomonas dyei]|uniref:Uncharacterized protein n=1 Tax=Xanthomonas dyei TaxID=743699 RepID=A0A2S7CAP6_9XANT|nr:hypothetical protein XdyCFBP7245_03520 [Xanthomonas dyei]